MSPEAFKLSMAMLSALYGKTLSDTVYNMYWHMLKQIPEDQYNKIQEKIVAEFIPTSTVQYPTIAHFLQAAGLSGDSKAKLAVQSLRKASKMFGAYRSVSFGDRALHATVERFGGWPVVALWGEDKWQFTERSFCEMYEANSVYSDGPEYCTGITERENAMRSVSHDQVASIADKAVVQFRWSGYKEIPISISDKSKGSELQYFYKPKELC